jgi:hypothetical protein
VRGSINLSNGKACSKADLFACTAFKTRLSRSALLTVDGFRKNARYGCFSYTTWAGKEIRMNDSITTNSIG